MHNEIIVFELKIVLRIAYLGFKFKEKKFINAITRPKSIKNVFVLLKKQIKTLKPQKKRAISLIFE